MRVFSGFSFVVRRELWGGLALLGVPFTLLLLVGALLTACSGINFGGATPATGTPTQTAAVALAKLHWCGKALMIFRDEGATTTTPTGTPSAGATATVVATATLATTGTPTADTTPVTTPVTTGATPVTITSWEQVQPQLGFSVYLPATLPVGSCLTSASGTIHDPIFGGSFTIGYLLADRSAVTFSEAPVRSPNSSLQCSVSANSRSVGKAATPTTTAGAKTQPLQVCTGVRDSTNIVFSARGTTETLTQFFKNLQSNVTWVPAS